MSDTASCSAIVHKAFPAARPLTLGGLLGVFAVIQVRQTVEADDAATLGERTPFQSAGSQGWGAPLAAGYIIGPSPTFSSK